MYLYDLDKLVFTEVIDRLVLEILQCVAVVSLIYLLYTQTHRDIRSRDGPNVRL